MCCSLRGGVRSNNQFALHPAYRCHATRFNVRKGSEAGTRPGCPQWAGPNLQTARLAALPYLAKPEILTILARMSRIIALLTVALAQPSAVTEREMLVASEEELSSSVRLIETADAVRFEFTGPDTIAPSVAIDLQSNGVIDSRADFTVGFDDDKAESPCLQLLISPSRATDCEALGDRAKVTKSRRGELSVVSFDFPKRQISADGFGFGFAISLWSKSAHYNTPLAGGDYRFGGRLNLTEGANFRGEAKSGLPREILPALRRYQGCLWTAIKALEPLEPSKKTKLKAVPASCAAIRSAALRDGVGALIASGASNDAAEVGLNGLLDQVDANFEELIGSVTKQR